eukprot:15447478-Alexandrium_andersonii.AAC.1
MNPCRTASGQPVRPSVGPSLNPMGCQAPSETTHAPLLMPHRPPVSRSQLPMHSCMYGVAYQAREGSA